MTRQSASRPDGPVTSLARGFLPRPPGTPRPRSGSTVAGRSPGFRVAAGSPPSRAIKRPSGIVANRLSGYSCGGSAGLAVADHRAPDFPFDPVSGNPSPGPS